jgi:hypothetical protein
MVTPDYGVKVSAPSGIGQTLVCGRSQPFAWRAGAPRGLVGRIGLYRHRLDRLYLEGGPVLRSGSRRGCPGRAFYAPSIEIADRDFRQSLLVWSPHAEPFPDFDGSGALYDVRTVGEEEAIAAMRTRSDDPFIEPRRLTLFERRPRDIPGRYGHTPVHVPRGTTVVAGTASASDVRQDPS